MAGDAAAALASTPRFAAQRQRMEQLQDRSTAVPQGPVLQRYRIYDNSTQTLGEENDLPPVGQVLTKYQGRWWSTTDQELTQDTQWAAFEGRPPHLPEGERLNFAFPSPSTGDYWHVLAASLLHQAYAYGPAKIVFGQAQQGRPDMVEKAERHRQQLQGSLATLGQESLIADQPVRFAPQENPSNRRWVEEISREHQALKPDEPIVDQKISTAVFMRYILEHGAQALQLLRTQMTHAATEEEAQWVLSQAATLLSRLGSERQQQAQGKSKQDKPLRKLLFINRREGHENRQHNTTPEQSKQLGKLASHPKTNMLAVHVAAGAYEPGDVDLFDQGLQGPKPAHTDYKRRTALFWAVMADLQRMGFVHGLVGGRSGSMDIAALMGLNTLSWDSPKPDAKQHSRLAQTHPLMALGRLYNDSGKLNQEDLINWLGGGHPAPPYDQDKQYLGSAPPDAQLESGEFLMYALRSKTPPPWAQDQEHTPFPYPPLDTRELPAMPLTSRLWQAPNEQVEAESKQQALHPPVSTNDGSERPDLDVYGSAFRLGLALKYGPLLAALLGKYREQEIDPRRVEAAYQQAYGPLKPMQAPRHASRLELAVAIYEQGQ